MQLTEPRIGQSTPGVWAGVRVHMIGIGGCGMSGAAKVLLERGAIVSGSDQSSFEGLGHLTSRGARITIGHGMELVSDDVSLVVMSAAIPESNQELALARQRGVRVIKYAELVGQLMVGCEGIAIAGTHGKSTTTALTAFLFREAGLDPSFIVGATSDQIGGSSAAGRGAHFVVEACEFDRSFLNFKPRMAAILNVEPDHLDCFRDLDEIVEAFSEFGQRTAPDGLVICNGDDPGTRRAMQSISRRIETFGFAEGSTWRAVDLAEDEGRFSFQVLRDGKRLLSTRLTIPGVHNVSNALAVVALGTHVGIDAGLIAEILPRFTGASRRMSWRGKRKGVTIVDDYAHHPTEIRVTLQAARSRYHPKKAWVIFQPHQQSRTKHFMDEFAASFSLADEVIVPDVYGARESDEAGCRESAKELVSRICNLGGRANYLPLKEVAAHLTPRVMDGDMVLTMGAGDVWRVADELVERIR